MGVFLTSRDRQVQRTRCQWIGAWVNVVASVLLILTFGIKGAAVSMLISETLLVILFAIKIRAFLSWPRVGSRLVMSVVATASFTLPFAFFQSLPRVLVISTSILLYSGTLLLFKDIRQTELRKLLSFIKPS